MSELLWRLFKVKLGWNIQPRKYCPNCKDMSVKPTAYNDAGEWHLHWFCYDCDYGMDEYGSIEWPMRRNFATVKDLERLGFDIVG